MASPLATALRGAARDFELSVAAEEEREAELTAAERYARDPFLLADEGHVWIWSKFDRRAVRLRLYQTQRELIVAWVDVEHLAKTGQLRYRNVVDDKSRQMGETWAVAFAILWALHFHPVNLFAHHVRAAEIDDGGMRNTWRSLFGKVRYMDIRLGASRGLADPSARAKVPGLGRALVFRPRSDTPARIEAPSTGAICYAGEQSTDPGRGGTFDGAAIDEAAFVPWGEKVHAALDEACPEGKLYLSTPNGDDNVHARLVDERPAGWRVLRHHWSEHPVYSEGLHVAAVEPRAQPSRAMAEAARQCALCKGNADGLSWSSKEPVAHRYPGRLASPWYDDRVIGKTDEQVAQELDIDRTRALMGRVFSEFEPERHVIAGGIPFEPLLPLELGWDFGLTTSVVICQDATDAYRVIGEVELVDRPGETTIPEKVVGALKQALLDVGYPRDLLAKHWTRRLYGIGDPSGHAPGTFTGLADVEMYGKLGFAIGRPPAAYTRRVEHSVMAVKRLLLGEPKPLVISGPACPLFVRHMRNNRWATDKLGRRRLSPTDVPQLENDEHNHMMRAFAYLVVTKFPPPVEPDESGPGPVDPGDREGVLDPGIRYDMTL